MRKKQIERDKKECARVVSCVTAMAFVTLTARPAATTEVSKCVFVCNTRGKRVRLNELGRMLQNK